MCTVTLHDLTQHVGVCEEQLKQKCTRPHLEKISKEMENWLDYAHHLGLSSQEITSIRTDSFLSYGAQARRVLEMWHNKNGFTATYGRLAEVFLEASNANIAEAVCKIAKTTRSPGSQSPTRSAGVTRLTSPYKFVESLTQQSPIPSYVLDKDTRENLEGRLQADAQEMDQHFCRVVLTIQKSLERREVMPATIGYQLSLMKAVTKQMNDENVPALFHLNSKELARVETIRKLFELIAPYFSFFNYDIIEQIVSEYGDSQDKETFAAYLEKFRQYCQRRATEVPPIAILDSEGPSTTKLKIKVEEDFQQIYTVKAVRAFRAKLCKILGVTEPCLRLLLIEEGCILLTFSLPIFVLRFVFPLSSEQERALAAEGGLEYAVGDCPGIKLPREASTKEASPVRMVEDRGKRRYQESSPIRVTRSLPQGVLTRSPDSSTVQPLQRYPPPPRKASSTPGSRKVVLQWPEASAKLHHSTSFPAHYSMTSSPIPIHTPHDFHEAGSHRLWPVSHSHSTRPLNLPLSVNDDFSPSSGGGDSSVPASKQEQELLKLSDISSVTPFPEASLTSVGFPESEGRSLCVPQSWDSQANSARPVTLPMRRKSDSGRQQVALLMSMYEQTKHTLGLFYTHREHGEFAGAIQKAMSHVFAKSENKTRVFQITHEGSHWTVDASREGVTKYIFLGHPPSTTFDSTSEEAKFFSNPGKRVTDILFVVNVQNGASQTQALERQWSSPWQKQLRKYLHLDGSLPVDQLVECILAHFIAPPPTPHDSDSVYWSSVPKLIRLKMKKRELGLTLVTREVSSAFSRIILVKVVSNDCAEELRHNLGKKTHIQSINGHFLDGLSLDEATTIIHRESEKKIVQLLVRYIHKADHSGAIAGGGKLDPTKEDLPIPILILADEHKTGFQLFSCLLESGTTSFSSSPLHLGETDVSPPRVKSSPPRVKSSPPRVKSSIASDAEVSPPPHKPPLSSPKQLSDFSQALQKLVVSESDEKNELISCSRETKIKSPADLEWIIQAASLQSYKHSTSGGSPLFSHRDLRQLQQLQIVGQKRFIFQTFREGFDRQMVHLYLRSSGFFLVVLRLEDMVRNSVREFDKLSYWLRLILSYFNASEDKRVLIVAMLDGTRKDEYTREMLRQFEAALGESDLHKCVFDLSQRKKQTRKQYVLLFDVSQPGKSASNLMAKINDCTDQFITEKCLQDKPFFKTVFEAFDGLNVALTELSLLTGVTASSKKLQLICSHKPSHALTSLAAYSTALVDLPVGDVLLKPGFLMDLIQNLGAHLLSILTENGRPQPIASRALVVQVIESLEPNIGDDSIHIILRLAEKFAILLPIGNLSKQGPAFFVPLLTADFLHEKALSCWDTKEAAAHYGSEAITFFVFLHFPATIHFFFKLLSLFIRDGFIDSACANNELLINSDGSEAILPQSCLGSLSTVSSVMLLYHSLQNVIEFRVLHTGQASAIERLLYEAVLKKVKILLKDYSPYQRCKFTEAVTLRTPSPCSDQKLFTSSLWKLWELQLQQEDDVAAADTHHADIPVLLLKTKEYQLQRKEPSCKEIPVDLYLKWGRKLSSGEDTWAMVGSKLNLLSTDDIQFLRYSGSKPGNGGDEVLRRWLDSVLSYKDLVSALRSPDVSLDSLANEIESFFSKSS